MVAAAHSVLNFWDELSLSPVSGWKDTLWWTIIPLHPFFECISSEWTAQASRKWNESGFGTSFAHSSIFVSYQPNEPQSATDNLKLSIFNQYISSLDTIGIFSFYK